MTFSFGKCNTDHSGETGKTGLHIVHKWETERNENCFSFSYYGIYQQPIWTYQSTDQTLCLQPPPRTYTCTHTHTHTQPDLSPQDVGTGWRSAVWGSRPAFPLGWHSAHINSTSLQKPLMQGRVLTVFWQWITICQPWPLFDCWSHWKTDLWQEQRLI